MHMGIFGRLWDLQGWGVGGHVGGEGQGAVVPVVVGSVQFACGREAGSGGSGYNQVALLDPTSFYT